MIQNKKNKSNTILIGGDASSNKYKIFQNENISLRHVFFSLFVSFLFFCSPDLFTENNEYRYYLSYSSLKIKDDFNFKHQLNACCSDNISFVSGNENSINLTSNYNYSEYLSSCFQISIAQTNLLFQDYSVGMITKEGVLYPIKIKNELNISFVNANISIYLLCFNPFKNLFIYNGINTGFQFNDNLEYKEELIDPVNVTFSNDSRIRNKIKLNDNDYELNHIVGIQSEIKYDIPLNQKGTVFLSTSLLYNYRIQTMKNQEINNHYYGVSIGLGGILKLGSNSIIQE